ncbi:hypothetical protein BWQ96_08045 [Gracilariopsis chorda]|uniref:Uncharacterized protein n=1 Tax=Gracilariopsis chorda TaxID=448386 RepID=A0A2V3IJG1_9FLOR|nr:hypothetical protein BWQ96_08045 [Gracilariopsis chorda]|eukprot:PXF42217.1 hypothetical protein BWQ96_08045 [Gracilariopsis chorda]
MPPHLEENIAGTEAHFLNQYNCFIRKHSQALDLALTANIDLPRGLFEHVRLEEDSVQIASCTRNAVSRKATGELAVENLNASDLSVAIAFVIDVDNRDKHCSVVQPVEGKDEADDVLFHVSDAVSLNENQVYRFMSMASDAEVAPEVDIGTSEKPSFVNPLPNTVVFRDSPLNATTTSLMSSSRNSMCTDSLPVATPPTISPETNVNLFTGAVPEVDASLSANISKFKVRRLFKTEVHQWEQSHNTRLEAQLTVNAAFTGERSGANFGRPIPQVWLLREDSVRWSHPLWWRLWQKQTWAAHVEIERCTRGWHPCVARNEAARDRSHHPTAFQLEGLVAFKQR